MTTRNTGATKTPAIHKPAPPLPQDWHAPLIDVFANVQDIIGSDSAYSLFHYAAQESGRKLARMKGPESLEHALELVQHWFPLTGLMLQEEGPNMNLQFQDEGWHLEDRRIVRATVLGLLEGALGFLRAAPIEGKVLNGTAPSSTVHVRFTIRQPQGGTKA